MYGFVFAFLGLLAAIPFSVLTLASAAGSTSYAASQAEVPLNVAAGFGIPAVFLGLGGLVLLPLLYGIVGFVVGFLHALIYNFIAGFAGGLMIETD